MLHLNTPIQGGARGGGDTYKVLILDATTQVRCLMAGGGSVAHL